MRHHLTLDRKSVIEKSANNKCRRGCAENGSLLHCCGSVNWYSHYRGQYGGSYKIKKRGRELTYGPAIPLLGMYLEKTKIREDAPQCSLQHLLQ